MSNQSLTDEERRNLEVVEEWMRCWNTKGMMAKMVDEIYADPAEVFTPIQSKYYSKKDGNKDAWRKLELLLEKLIQKREMRLVTTVAKGNMVILEAIAATTTLGRTVERWTAAFLTFDDDGKVVSDHTYMPLSGFERLLEKIITRFIK